MKRLFVLAFLLSALACGASAQAVDTTVCAVLKDPASFNGKTVRIKGTVVASFDQFIITDGDCGKDADGIWLAYPQGTKAKSGPVMMVEVAPAHNFAGTAAPGARPAVTLTRDKAFKQFDSSLAQKHEQFGVLCLDCPRYRVQATLVGRLDGVADATVQRDAKGKITGLGGFGNLNAYPARLVLESVTDVAPKEIDYSASNAAVKKAESASSGGPAGVQDQSDSDPIATAQKLTARMAGSPIGTQMQTDVALLPKDKQQNGVNLMYGPVDEVSPTEGTPTATDTPDGVVFNCTFNRDRLPGVELSMALMHAAQEVSDTRNPSAGNEAAPPYILESNAWAVTASMAVANGEKFLILPGGYVLWNSTWADGDKVNNMTAALNDYLTKEAMLSR